MRIRQMHRPGFMLTGFANDPDIVIILIALGPLTPSNGLFLPNLELSSGEDVAIPGDEPIQFSGSGGGLGVIIFLGFGE